MNSKRSFRSQSSVYVSIKSGVATQNTCICRPLENRDPEAPKTQIKLKVWHPHTNTTRSGDIRPDQFHKTQPIREMPPTFSGPNICPGTRLQWVFWFQSERAPTQSRLNTLSAGILGVFVDFI